jgi:hypothetical protein
MMIGIVGKTNTGKTTFFSAATLVDAEISNRIFTTIKPNKGMTYVRSLCVCKELDVVCNPKNSKCIDGTRLIPFQLVDIAGLVPGAHEGRGLGNRFLSDIMTAQALIHVVDISGSTDTEGNPISPGSNNPMDDINFLEKEIDFWILGIIKNGLKQWSKRVEMKEASFVELLQKQLSGLQIKPESIKNAIKEFSITHKSSDSELLKFIKLVRELNKPMLIAANKIDVAGAKELFENIKEKTSAKIIPCSALAELTLRKADQNGFIKYIPGDSDFSVLKPLNNNQKKGLDYIKENVLKKIGSTGIQKIIDSVVFEALNMIVVYPVSNEHKFTDNHNNVLPDAFLVPNTTTARELAYRIHEDLGENFITAIDAKTGKTVGADYQLKNNDVISIKAKK